MFTSSSSTKTYQTLQYDDSTTSCDCPGWTRRVTKNGRTCRHTRSVDLGTADAEATNFIEYAPLKPVKKKLHTGEIVTVQGCVVIDEEETKKTTTPVLQYGNRKLCI